MADRKLMFWPGSMLTYSDTFRIPVGGQKTVVALGLLPGETITFEIVFVPAKEAELCKCPPSTVELPSVVASAPLTCGGAVVTLDDTHPFVVINAPQDALIRAIQTVTDDNHVWAWQSTTETEDVTDLMRGCA